MVDLITLCKLQDTVVQETVIGRKSQLYFLLIEFIPSHESSAMDMPVSGILGGKSIKSLQLKDLPGKSYTYFLYF